MNKAIVGLIVLGFCLVAIGLMVTWDEQLDEETREWLEAPPPDKAESLDYLYLLGIAAPEEMDPVTHGRAVMLHLQDEPGLQLDLVAEQIVEKPCELDDLDCWQEVDNAWLTRMLDRNGYILDRWRVYPVHNDFHLVRGAPLFSVLTSVAELVKALETLALVESWRSDHLNDHVQSLVEHTRALGKVPDDTDDLLSLLIMYAKHQWPMEFLMHAIRWGGEFPGGDSIAIELHEPIPVERLMAQWARREFHVAPSIVRIPVQWPFLLRENSTLNRARYCLEQAAALGDFDRFLNTPDSRDCAGQPRRLYNWIGDDLVSSLLLTDTVPACRAHIGNTRLMLARSLIDAHGRFTDAEQRLAHVAESNPYGADAGVVVEEDRICYDMPATHFCTKVCLAAPWEMN